MMSSNNCLFFLFILLGINFTFAQQDTIVLKNKDRLIGEIKSMENGVLIIETDYSDSDFKVKWLDIEKLNSEQVFLINLVNGERISSKIVSDLENGKIKLHDEINTNHWYEVAISDIVYIKSVKDGFLSRLNASLSVGFNYTKNSALRQFSVRSNLGYTATFWRINASFNSMRSSQDGTNEITRTDADAGFRYFLKNNNFLMFSSEFLSNDEQKLKLRMTTRGGFGHYFVHTNKMYVGGMLGLAWNNESFTNIPETRNSAEGFLGFEANLFDIEDFSLLTTAVGYPSITEKNRFRADFKTDLKYDLPLDFFIKVGFTYNFDSKPVEDAPKEDYIIQTTLGWEL